MPKSAPNVIFTMTFKKAATQYLNYTERQEAVSNDPEQVRQAQEAERKLDGYLGYTEREAATVIENDAEGAPTFNDQSLNLSDDEHQQLVDNLKEAQDRGSTMWVGVVSFNPAYLKEAGILSQDGKHVDQRAIKRAIQSAMPDLLKNEQLDDPGTFWWGDVHLNTNHVHVHLTISQLNNTREVLPNGDPKGQFRWKTFRQFKSRVVWMLNNEWQRKKQQDNYKEIARLKTDLKDQVINQIDLTQNGADLLKIWQNLPNYKDQRRWRASNHSKPFQPAHQLVDQLVDKMLQGALKDDYTAYRQALMTRDRLARQNYGQKIKDTVAKNDQVLRDYLANRIYDHFRQANQEFIQENLTDQMPQLDLATNNRILDQKIEELSKLPAGGIAARQLRQEIGIRKAYVRQENLKLANASLVDQELALSKLPPSPLRDYFLKQVKDHQEYNQLRMMSRHQRTKQGLDKCYQELTGQFIDPRKMNVNKATPEVVQTRMERIGQTVGLMAKFSYDPAVKIMFPNQSAYGVSNALQYYQAQQQVLQLKGQIYANNQKFKDDPRQRSEANGPLFKALKKPNYLLDHSEKIDQQLDFEHQRQEQAKEVAQEQQKAQIDRNIKGFANKLTQGLQSATQEGKARVRALKKHLDGEVDELERADEEEKNQER